MSLNDVGTIFVSIPWDYSKERVRLDLTSLSSGRVKSIATWEVWKEDGRTVHLSARVKYQVLNDGNHEIQLEYRPSDHPKLRGFDCTWGRSTIVVDKSLRTANATWTTVPESPELDGAVVCKVHLEKQASIKVQRAKVRTNQSRFKKSLERWGSCCVITGETLTALLDAAHIHDVEDGGSDEPENGVLMRADVHRLFDGGYFAIGKDGRLALLKHMPSEYADQLKGRVIDPETIARIRPYLDLRRKR